MLSQRIEVTTIRILEMVIDMSGKDTREYRKKILNETHKLQILFRVSKDLAYLDTNKYEFASSLLTEISDLLDYQDSKPKTEGSEYFSNRGGLEKP